MRMPLDRPIASNRLVREVHALLRDALLCSESLFAASLQAMGPRPRDALA